MDSPETELRSSYDASAPSGQGRRGPNPNRDYKRHFIRQKERYNTVTADQANRKKELNRASSKQWKLQDEIEFIIDAIAGERHRRQQTSTAAHFLQADPLPRPTEVSSTITDGSRQTQPTYEPTIEQDEEDVKPILTANQAAAAASKQKSAVDEDLEGLLDEQDIAATPAKESSRKSVGTSNTTSAKRKNYFSSSEDTDDELLEAAGVSSSKRARNR